MGNEFAGGNTALDKILIVKKKKKKKKNTDIFPIASGKYAVCSHWICLSHALPLSTYKMFLFGQSIGTDRPEQTV